MKTIRLVTLLLLVTFTGVICYSQISGPSEVDLNDTVTYINTNGSCGSDCITYLWEVSGSYSMVSYSQSQIQVCWTQSGIVKVTLKVIDNLGQTHTVDEESVVAGMVREVCFSYDATGNRTGREKVYLSSSKKSIEGPIAPEEFEEDIEITNEIKLYPNPFRELVIIALDDEAYESKKKYVELYDNLGRLRKSVILTDYVNEIQASDLPDGTYILRLSYDGQHREWIIVKHSR